MASSPHVETRRTDRAADAVWRRLCEGMHDPWLDDIRALRTDGDDLDATLDIWSVALIAELKNPARKEPAATVLARLRKLSDEIEGVLTLLESLGSPRIGAWTRAHDALVKPAAADDVRCGAMCGAPIDLQIVHRGDEYVIVDKPPGIHSVPGRGPDKQDSIAGRVRAAFPEADGPISVHRLDLDTSGLMVLALTRGAHRALSSQFMNRKTGKTYTAVLDGVPADERGAVDLPLIVDWPNRPRQMVDHDRGRPARTLYAVIERAGDRTRVEFRPITGRTHQLRVHAATPRAAGGLGAPILGDPLYGDPTAAPRMLLHADMLAFWDPTTHAWMKFKSPAPF